MAPKDDPKKQDLGLPANMVDYFFPMKQESQPAIVRIANVLRNQGVSTTHLRQAIAIIIGIMSSKLGDPVPMIITEDEGAGAMELLHTCLNLVPADSWIEEPTGKLSKTEESSFEGKTVICHETDSAKDLLSRLLSEVELRSKIVQTRRHSVLRKPIAFVALTKNPNTRLLENRYATRIHVNADQESKEIRLSSLVQKVDLESLRQHKIESACLRTLLSRIKANPVDIEFADKVIKQDASRFQNAVPFIDSMLRILRNITRINNSPQLQPEELQAAFIGLDLDDLVAGDSANEIKPIKATKVDYYYLSLVFGDTFKVNNDFLTPRQFAIFNAIFRQNIEYQNGLTSHKNSSPQQMLNDYDDKGFNKGWVTREDIEASLKGQIEEFSYSTLHKELQVLLKFDFIKAKKVPRRTNKYCYVATKPLGEEFIIETDISKVENPDFNKQSTEVYNFLTETLEKI